jgi:MraZ protein
VGHGSVLLGNYRLSLDDKGRLSIPAALRSGLREQFAPDDTTLILTKYFENCLVIYPKPVWLGIQTQLLNLPNDPPSRDFLRQFCASANVCHLDRQGRILVPAALRQYAGIDGEAMIIGLMRKLEVWSPDRWEDTYDDNQSTQFDTNAHLMNLQL